MRLASRSQTAHHTLVITEVDASFFYEDTMKSSAATSNASGNALMTSEQAAKYLGFTDGWLAKLRMRGGGPKYIRLGRKCRYAPADLDTWLAAHRVSNTSEKSQAQREGWA